MKDVPKLIIIQGGKIFPRVSRQDKLFGVKAFAVALIISFMAAFWPDIQSDVHVISVPSVSRPLSRPDLRIIDGDTMQDTRSGVRYRLVDVDTPETGRRARCMAERRLGEQAKEMVRTLVAGARNLEIKPEGRLDRYGRTLAYIEVDGRNLGSALVDYKLARPWGGRRMPWCDGRGNLIY